jgi:uncharacterized protein (DUF952 family)
MAGNPSRTARVFKIVRRSDWIEAVARGDFRGSGDDHRHGFIHLSAGDQLAGTAAKHFRHVEGLILVAFNIGDLAANLKWEVSRGGELFPHYYGPLPARAALWTRPMPLGCDGIPVVPVDVTVC